jgi:hypothetical protein
MTLPIAVIESRWDDGSLNTVSVRTFFELLGALYEGNPGSFHYEMFSCTEALQEILPRIGKDERFDYAYVACHGKAEGLCAHNGDLISRTVLRNLLKQPTAFKGLHLATCSFGTPELATFFFENGDLSVSWISGYRKRVDWADSSPLDLMFLHLLLESTPTKAIGRKERYKTEHGKITSIAETITRLMRGSCDELGFSIYVRNRRGTVVDLISKD